VVRSHRATTTQEDTVSEREKRRNEEPEVEAHGKSRRLNEDAAVEPEDRAGQSREDDEPDVEAHGKYRR
jgi:hypothetical protein